MKEEVKKKCSCCKEKLPLSLFPLNKSRKDGINTICTPCDTKRNKEWRSRNPETYNKKQYRYIAKYPERQRAREKVGNALRRGLIKRLPCEVCGETQVHAHHEDYAKPLEVNWLCVKHHTLKHTKKS